jgi:hypothetical protein
VLCSPELWEMINAYKLGKQWTEDYERPPNYLQTPAFTRLDEVSKMQVAPCIECYMSGQMRGLLW